jgi:hypothetical protein
MGHGIDIRSGAVSYLICGTKRRVARQEQEPAATLSQGPRGSYGGPVVKNNDGAGVECRCELWFDKGVK